MSRIETAAMKSCGDGALLQPPARMPTCRPRDRVAAHADCSSPSVTAVACLSPSSSADQPPLLDLSSPTAPPRAAGSPQRSPRSQSTAASGVSSAVVGLATHSCPSAASDDDSGCALEEYAWVPPGLSAVQVFISPFFPLHRSPNVSSRHPD